MQFRSYASSSAGNLYSIEQDGAALLLECGLRPAELLRILGFRLDRYDGALLSHAHGDHSCGHEAVLRAGCPIFAPAACLDALGLGSHHLVHPADHLELFSIPSRGGGAWRILPFALQHDDDQPCLGYLVEAPRRAGEPVERLLYACDTAWIPYRFRGATHLALECNFSEALLVASAAPVAQRARVLRSHMSLERLTSWLKTTDLESVREIHLLHLSGAHSDAAMFQREVEEATGKPVYVAAERLSHHHPPRGGAA